jgi:LmbE family N-acetylglucosaminyl deacetylase
MRETLVTWLQAVGKMVTTDATRELSRGSALVFAPHPDDEVLGCGGTIAIKSQAGETVTVVVMTDGRSSHAGRIPPDALVSMRHAEALEAAARLGLPAGACLFLDFPDQELASHAVRATQTVMDLLHTHAPQHVFVPSRRDGLADHDATFDIARAAVVASRRPVTLLEYPIWLWENWPWSGRPTGKASLRHAVIAGARSSAELVLRCRHRVCIAPVLPKKLDALAAYRSQMEKPPGDPDWPTLADVADGQFLRRFTGEHEIFRRTDFRQ